MVRKKLDVPLMDEDGRKLVDSLIKERLQTVLEDLMKKGKIRTVYREREGGPYYIQEVPEVKIRTIAGEDGVMWRRCDCSGQCRGWAGSGQERFSDKHALLRIQALRWADLPDHDGVRLRYRSRRKGAPLSE